MQSEQSKGSNDPKLKLQAPSEGGRQTMMFSATFPQAQHDPAVGIQWCDLAKVRRDNEEFSTAYRRCKTWPWTSSIQPTTALRLVRCETCRWFITLSLVRLGAGMGVRGDGLGGVVVPHV